MFVTVIVFGPSVGLKAVVCVCVCVIGLRVLMPHSIELIEVMTVPVMVTRIMKELPCPS